MFGKLTRPHIAAFISRYATKERILDVGFGGSPYSNYFPQRFTIDVRPECNPDLVADAHNLPFSDNEFAHILCTEVLEHTQHPEQVAHELMRVLQPGGVLILTTRFVYPIHDGPGDYFRFTKYGLQELFGEWDILETQSELGDFSTIAALLQRIGFQTSVRGGKFTKLLLYAVAWLVSKLDWLVVKEYGDIRKSVEERNILSTGVYIAVRKPQEKSKSQPTANP